MDKITGQRLDDWQTRFDAQLTRLHGAADSTGKAKDISGLLRELEQFDIPPSHRHELVTKSLLRFSDATQAALALRPKQSGAQTIENVRDGVGQVLDAIQPGGQAPPAEVSAVEQAQHSAPAQRLEQARAVIAQLKALDPAEMETLALIEAVQDAASQLHELDNRTTGLSRNLFSVELSTGSLLSGVRMVNSASRGTSLDPKTAVARLKQRLGSVDAWIKTGHEHYSYADPVIKAKNDQDLRDWFSNQGLKTVLRFGAGLERSIEKEQSVLVKAAEARDRVALGTHQKDEAGLSPEQVADKLAKMDSNGIGLARLMALASTIKVEKDAPSGYLRAAERMDQAGSELKKLISVHARGIRELQDEPLDAAHRSKLAEMHDDLKETRETLEMMESLAGDWRDYAAR